MQSQKVANPQSRLHSLRTSATLQGSMCCSRQRHQATAQQRRPSAACRSAAAATSGWWARQLAAWTATTCSPASTVAITAGEASGGACPAMHQIVVQMLLPQWPETGRKREPVFADQEQTHHSLQHS